MSDTPRTDSLIMVFPDGDFLVEVVDCDFARQLERELDAMTIEMREAFRLINVLMMADGPTWPRVLEWMERNQQFKP